VTARNPRQIVVDHIETTPLDDKQREQATNTLAALILDWINTGDSAPGQTGN
jgi:hypothetical protein